ncbi:GMC family oxidoreductase [Pseudalkalibacillus decolorationis]|uniref:GMC family oxidoreductase n=1 Tax=Pseudalkalibacillus decolorationis TaxID=163879 RepID=UPI002148000A|nr:GMC family oxidoreductase [Pseudalkalibacillus decolorationis]
MSRKTFDYIVVGAGTAGGVIAKELSDDNHTSVLVLEPGTNMTEELRSASSSRASALATDNKFSFNILSKIEPNIRHQLRLSSGRAIGGSSEHNAMYAVRGSEELYDEWASLVGSQWSYDSIRSLFKRNETYTGSTQEKDERGTKGPIYVRQQTIPKGRLIPTLVKATSDTLNIPIVEDYNTGIKDCTFLKSQFLQKEEDGQYVRSSTATGYLNEEIVTQGDEFNPDEFGVDGRRLVILTKTTVNKVLFEKDGKDYIAVGVEVVRDGKSQRAFAKKGIIIAAGNFSSVILQRSGIGRTSDLAEAGISTLIESPNVGHNFQAHFTGGIGVEIETTRLQQVINADPDMPFPLGAFKGEGRSGGRRLQLYGSTGPRFVPIQDVHVNDWEYDPNKTTNVMSIGIFDLNPKSRGTILAAHSDPEAYPSINLNPLTDPDDLDFMVDQYIEAFNIMKRARRLDKGGVYKVVYPPENVFNLTDEKEKRKQLTDYVKASYHNIAHFGGQCKMGRNIREGVVDGYLNVFGTKNLKVADLSISPILPDGNTSMPAQIIGLNAVRFLNEEFSS